ncbi:MAG: fibronectin type III domain-containing protein [Chloroflexi bacterium]|nr:fibronectin type III domain-containing protein [Chloroflexota bacterium]
MIRIAGLMWTLSALVLIGCSISQSSESMDAALSGPPGTPSVYLTPHPALVLERNNYGLSHPARIIPLDIETLIETSDTIARVRLMEVEPYVAVTTPEHLNGDKLYSPYMGFKFEVLEYLMGGNGLSNIWGMVKLDEADRSSEEEALKEYAFYLSHRDTKWDDREAVVFLSDSLPDWPSTHSPDRYALGYFESRPLVERHSIAANRGWLPLASAGETAAVFGSGASGASSGSKAFLMDHPDGCVEYRPGCGTGGGVSHATESSASSSASGSASESTAVGLEELKRKIAGQIADPELADRLRFEKAKNNMSEWMTVRNLTATATQNSVTLRWDEPGQAVEFVSGYRVLRRVQTDADFVIVADVPSENENRECFVCPATYEDTDGIESGTEYAYLVRAVTAHPNNGTDAQVVVTTAGTKSTQTPPSEPTATATLVPTATPIPAP